jgi:hypothetical protein
VGLSEASNDKLDELKEMGVFADKIDGYRFGVSLALAHGAVTGDLVKRETLFNVGSLDPDKMLKEAVEALMSEELKQTTVYRLIERLADWGVAELHAQAKNGEIEFVTLLEQAASN